jgi:hypothetical protein
LEVPKKEVNELLLPSQLQVQQQVVLLGQQEVSLRSLLLHLKAGLVPKRQHLLLLLLLLLQALLCLEHDGPLSANYLTRLVPNPFLQIRLLKSMQGDDWWALLCFAPRSAFIASTWVSLLLN